MPEHRQPVHGLPVIPSPIALAKHYRGRCSRAAASSVESPGNVVATKARYRAVILANRPLSLPPAPRNTPNGVMCSLTPTKR